MSEESRQTKPIQPFLRYRGGKSHLAKRIVKIFPKHRVYVEPMVGGGSVYFAKQPAWREVISDVDSDLMRFYRTLKSGDVARCDLTPSRPKLQRLQTKRSQGKELSPCEYLYLNKLSFGGTMSSYDKHAFKTCKGEKARSCNVVSKNLDDYAERMRRTTVVSGDFRRIMERFDSPNTLFYLDPPYKDTNRGGYRGKELSPSDVAQAARKARGKVAVSYIDTPEARKALCGNGLHCRKLATTYSMGTKGEVSQGREILATNWIGSKRSAVK